MSQKSLGIIETIGLTAAVEAADTALKAASVELVGYELSKGSGMTVVKVEGNVGAVKAAIDAAAMASARVGTVVSTRVIPRPSQQIEILVRNSDTVGYEKTQPHKSDADDREEQAAAALPAHSKPDAQAADIAQTDLNNQAADIAQTDLDNQAADIAQTDLDNQAADIAQTDESEADQAQRAPKPISAAVQGIPERVCVREALWPQMTTEPKPETTLKSEKAAVLGPKAASKPEPMKTASKLEATQKSEKAAALEPKAASKPEPMKTASEPESYTCNLCKDPNCPRQKGDLKQLCIHYRKKK